MADRYRAIAHRAWGASHRLSGEHAEAATRLGQAMQLFERLDARWLMGRTFVELADLARAQSDTTAARDRFSRVLTLFQELNAGPDAAATDEVLPSIR